MDTFPFNFFVLVNIFAKLNGLSVFFCESGIMMKFFVIARLRKRLQLVFKTDLTTNGLIWEFFVEICLVSSSSYLHGLKSE